jgi:hypothetical protein
MTRTTSTAQASLKTRRGGRLSCYIGRGNGVTNVGVGGVLQWKASWGERKTPLPQIHRPKLPMVEEERGTHRHGETTMPKDKKLDEEGGGR